MDKRTIIVILEYVICTYNEYVLPLFKVGGRENLLEGSEKNLQEASGFLFCIGSELEKIKEADAMPEMYAEIIRLRAVCQAFRYDSPVEHFKIVVEPIISQLEELSKSLSQDSD